MFTIQTRFNCVWLLLIASVLIGCSPGSTPPGANSIGGVVDGGSYSYHYWEEGLAILIWQDASYGTGESCSGTGSTEDPVYRLECDVDSTDGQTFSWKVDTRDGVAAESMPNIETVVTHDVDTELLSRHRATGRVQNWNDRRLDLYRITYTPGASVGGEESDA